MSDVQLNKVTPHRTIDWWIKWVASISLLIAMLLASNNIYPYNLWFQGFGLVGWFIVAMHWNDRAHIVINTAGLAFILNGLFEFYIKKGILPL